ncbi:MAG TPA: hypothetical protein VF978_08000 [Gemmatimonadales bacterium]
MSLHTKHPVGYWATTLYKDPRMRPRSDQPLKDLPPRSSTRFKKAREGVRALKHVTEQVVFLGTTWKWVWMYEVGGRKLAYLHPMESGVSGTFVLTGAEEDELVTADGLPRVVRQAVRDGEPAGPLKWCWMDFPDLDTVDAFVYVVRQKHHFLARPE